MLFTRGPQQIRTKKQVMADRVVVISAKAGVAIDTVLFFFSGAGGVAPAG